jgi:hypothetical protein
MTWPLDPIKQSAAVDNAHPYKQVQILPFRIENVLPAKSLEYFLSSLQAVAEADERVALASGYSRPAVKDRAPGHPIR